MDADKDLIAPRSPCDVAALKRCLDENNGDHKKCKHLVEAFESSCSKPNQAAVSPLLQVRRSHDSSRAGTDSKVFISNAAEGLLIEVTKMAVLFGGASRPSEQEAAAIMDSFQQNFAALCAAVHNILAGAGPTMHSAVTGAVSGMLRSCETFLEDLMSQDNKGQLPQRVGVIAQRLDKVKRLPLDNKVALGRKLTLCMRQVRDAHREAKELVAAESASAWNEQPSVAGTFGTAAQLQQERSSPEESSATEDARVNGIGTGSSDLDSSVSAHVSGGSNSHPGDSSRGAILEQSSYAASEGADVASATGIGVSVGAEQPPEEGINNSIVVDYEADELSPVEREVAAAAGEVMRHLVDMLSAVIKVLLRGNVPVGHDVESWESVGFHCKNLEVTANDLVAELYGPQDAEQLGSAAQAVASGKELILEDLPDTVLEQHGSTLAGIDQCLTAAIESLEQKISQSLQEHQGHDLSSEE
ncbi:g2005 [Coccomyxa elongata]